jgi:hypothetical protein
MVLGNRGRAASAIFVLALIAILVIIVVFYSGKFSLTSLPSFGGNTTTTSSNSTFSVAASANQTSVLFGRGATAVFTYLNPFTQQLASNVSLQVYGGASPYLEVLPPASAVFSMPQRMISLASVSFGLKCIGSSQSSQQVSTVFNTAISGFWQNVTTSVVVYPYNSVSPVTEYTPASGFLSISASPIEIETGVPQTTNSGTLSMDFAPAVYSGLPFTGTPSGTPNRIISKVMVSISNQSGGVLSAYVPFNGQNYQLSYNPSTKILSTSISSIPLYLISNGLSLIIQAANSGKSSVNLINVSTQYNYEFQTTGPIITCI